MNKNHLALCVAGALMISAAPAFAITDDEANASLQFSFVPPGARSLGMAGAFIGLADDATAAYSNPAGLSQLVSSEVSFEFRGARYSTPFLSGDGPDFDSADSSENGLGFLSVVLPYENWSFAFYRHEYLRYSTDFIGAADSNFLLPFATDIEVEGINYGGAVAYKFSDNFSLGVGVAYSQFDLDSATVRPEFATTQRGDDDDIVFNVGMRWKASDRLSVGVVYRDGGNFEYTASSIDLGTGAINPGFPKDDIEFNVPSSFGAGINFKVTDVFGIALDVTRMQYSDLTSNVRSGFAPDSPAADLGVKPLQIDDGTEIRLGGEYVFAEMQNPFVVRAGVWRDPEHTVRFRGEPDPAGLNAEANALLFSIGDDEIHYTLGFGIAFDNFQIDAAADFSDPYDVYSVSGVYRF
jgi:long-chain fatty acid transport protein